MTHNLLLIAILATLALGGCTTMPGVYNGVGEDPMGKLVVYRTDGNTLKTEQYRAVVEVVQYVQAQIDLQLTSRFESALSSALPFGATGVVGGAIEGGIIPMSAGGATGFLGGAFGGLLTDSYARVWAIAGPTEYTLRDREARGEKIFESVHVEAAFIRSRNTITAPAPGLVGN